MFDAGILCFDGGMGTELYERGFYINRPFEELNLNAAADVVAVHESYIDAGSQIITTNTFAVLRPQLKKFDIEQEQGRILRAALENASRARALRPGAQARIALSLGPMGVIVEPLGPTGLDEVTAEYEHTARAALAANVNFDLYALETFTNINELNAAIDGIRRADPMRPILASVSLKTDELQVLEFFARKVGKRADVQALGLNCSEGPSTALKLLQHLRPLTDKPIIVQPNAGIPRHLNGRYFYMTSPDYLAKYARRFVEAGAAGVGGCCGTRPLHIRAIAGAVRMSHARAGAQETVRLTSEATSAHPRLPLEQRRSRIGQLLAAGKKVLSIEVNPPKGTDLEKFLGDLDRIEKAGVAFVNVPDGARASARVNSLHLASHVAALRRKLTILPHFTTRDRNLIGLQSDLLGAAINGVCDVLLVTGDPPKLGNTPDATGVYDIDSIGLTYLADCLNRGITARGEVLGSATSFGIGVASNPTAANLELEIERWRYKVESGADFAVTQPIYDPESFLRWKDRTCAHARPHLVGIWPFVSLRNAEFMANEVPGVFVPEWALEEMAKAGNDKVEAAKRGVEIARRVMGRLQDVCEGFVISAPLGRVDVALETLR